MKVKIHYLFSKNNKIGSKVISWATNHQYNFKITPSHVAILINDRWVFESTLFTGVRVIPYKKWVTFNDEVAKIQSSQLYDYSEIKTIYKQIQNKKYDWLGAAYLGIWLILNKFFKTKIPKINRWESKDLYFCCEGVAIILGLSYFAMRSPADVLVDVLDHPQP